MRLPPGSPHNWSNTDGFMLWGVGERSSSSRNRSNSDGFMFWGVGERSSSSRNRSKSDGVRVGSGDERSSSGSPCNRSNSDGFMFWGVGERSGSPRNRSRSDKVRLGSEGERSGSPRSSKSDEVRLGSVGERSRSTSDNFQLVAAAFEVDPSSNGSFRFCDIAVPPSATSTSTGIPSPFRTAAGAPSAKLMMERISVQVTILQRRISCDM
jgi:hypothetical protein